MGVATSTGNHSNSTSPHRNKAPTRLVTGPSKNWGWNRSTPLSITSAPPPCCGSQGSQQPSGGNPTFSTIFGSFFLLWQRAQKKGVERFHPPSSISPQRLQYCGLQGGEQLGVDVFKINANSSILCIENHLPRLPSPPFETLLLLLL